MDGRVARATASQSENKRRKPERANIQSLGHDILCSIFVFLDVLDVARCSAVCKFWNAVISRSDLLRQLYYKNIGNDGATSSRLSDKSINELLEELAMQTHRASICRGSVLVDQWKGHAIGGDQCRMRRGVILTGGGSDKDIRLWSSESYKCLEQYHVPEFAPLVDLEFDENKIVGLLGTRLCIWRRKGNMTLFPPNETTYAKGSCMRYIDPEAIVGCEDGTVRVFDMYSKKCSQIIRMHSCAITSLALGEDQLIMSGSSLGGISLYGPSFARNPVTLKNIDRTGIRTLCYNPSSRLLFAGSTAGTASCRDLRMMRSVWENRISTNVLYSMGHLCNDKSTLVAGGIDAILRIIDQNSGKVLAGYVMVDGLLQRRTRGSARMSVVVEQRKGRRVTAETGMEVPVSVRSPIRCLAVGLNKVVTTHSNSSIRVWKFQQRGK